MIMVKKMIQPQSLRIAQTLMLFTILFFTAFVLVAFLLTNRIEYLLIGFSFIPSFILITPILLSRPYDLFHPLNFVALTTIIGITLRTIYIVTVDDYTTRTFLMLGRPIESMFTGLAYATLGIISLVLGFSMKISGLNVNRLGVFGKDNWNYKKLNRILWVLAIIAIISILIYFQRIGLTPEILLSRISGKRRFIVEGADYKYAALAYYLWGASLTDYVFFFLLITQLALRKPLFSFLGIATLGMGLLACIFPIIVSSRSSLLVLLLTALMIWNYMRRISLLQVVSIMGVASLLIVILGLLRNQNTDEVSLNAFSIENISQTILPAVVGNRNFFGVDKTTHIIQAIPERLRFQYGQTLFLWAVAPVPRTFWKDKPIISVGQIIGPSVFGHELNITGVPPGFVAELYWNGGVLAVVLGMFFLGMWLKFLYLSFGKIASQNKNALLFYIVLVFPFGFLILGGDFSRAMIEALRSVVTISAILLVVSNSEKALR